MRRCQDEDLAWRVAHLSENGTSLAFQYATRREQRQAKPRMRKDKVGTADFRFASRPVVVATSEDKMTAPTKERWLSDKVQRHQCYPNRLAAMVVRSIS